MLKEGLEGEIETEHVAEIKSEIMAIHFEIMTVVRRRDRQPRLK